MTCMPMIFAYLSTPAEVEPATLDLRSGHAISKSPEPIHLGIRYKYNELISRVALLFLFKTRGYLEFNPDVTEDIPYREVDVLCIYRGLKSHLSCVEDWRVRCPLRPLT
ncbi:hypothetical protein TNCV_548791 [Trichonephila clavipes]|nr:hypothetical protein TNCV_548791 [Trichonephila clavipes]